MNHFLHLFLLIVVKLSFSVTLCCLGYIQSARLQLIANTPSVRFPEHGTTSPLGGDGVYVVMSQVLLSSPC